MSKKQKIIFVAQHPIHYHAAIYRRAAQDPELDADVYFMQQAWSGDGFEPEFGRCIDWGIPITDGYEHRFFRNISLNPNGSGFFKFINPGLVWKILTGPRATIYIHGMNYFTHLACIIAAFVSGKKIVLRSITYDVTKPKGLKGAFRDAVYRLIFTMPSKFLYIGAHNRTFFRNHGVPERKLVHAPHIVDNAFFARKAAQLAPREADIKARLGILPEKNIITFVGKMTKGKQGVKLLRAFLDAALDSDWVIVFVGTGEQWDALHEIADEAPSRVFFTGFLNQIELCDVYAITDIFALPSLSETWGLVINEAMNFGCAVIASDKVGCAPDLVDGKSGIVFPAGDSNALVAALRNLALDRALLAEKQAAALKLIAEWDDEHYIVGLKQGMGLREEPLREKIIFVAQHPIHYHAAIYRRAARDPELDCEICFMQKAWARDGYEPEFGRTIDWGIPITDGYPHRFYTNISPIPNGEGFFKFINPGLIWRILTAPRATVYVHGMNYFTHLGCIVAAYISGKRIILRSITYDVTKPLGFKGMARDIIYRIIFSMPSKFLYIGVHNFEFFRHHGVPEEKLVHAPHIVDNAFFARKAKELAPLRNDIKARLGIAPDAKVVTFVGKIVERKQPVQLFRAFIAAGLGEHWVLVMVGVGPELQTIAREVATVQPRVVLTGYLDQIAVCDIYSVADIFALPSTNETWGLVVNEALNFGCAIIASDSVGCAPDLVEGKTGLVVPVRDSDAMVAALRRLALDEGFLAQMQAGARRLITDWDDEHYIAGLKRAILEPSSVQRKVRKWFLLRR